MKDEVVRKLIRADADLIRAALESRVQAYEQTAEYLENEDALILEGFTPEDCQNSVDANVLAANFLRLRRILDVLLT